MQSLSGPAAVVVFLFLPSCCVTLDWGPFCAACSDRSAEQRPEPSQLCLHTLCKVTVRTEAVSSRSHAIYRLSNLHCSLLSELESFTTSATSVVHQNLLVFPFLGRALAFAGPWCWSYEGVLCLSQAKARLGSGPWHLGIPLLLFTASDSDRGLCMLVSVCRVECCVCLSLGAGPALSRSIHSVSG